MPPPSNTPPIKQFHSSPPATQCLWVFNWVTQWLMLTANTTTTHTNAATTHRHSSHLGITNNNTTRHHWPRRSLGRSSACSPPTVTSPPLLIKVIPSLGWGIGSWKRRGGNTGLPAPPGQCRRARELVIPSAITTIPPLGQ